MRRVVALLVCMLALSGDAAQVTIRWTFADKNMDGTPITDLMGAKVYYGTASSNYTHVIDVPGGYPGQTVIYTVTELVEGVTYYLNGTAYNTLQLESDFCTEIVRAAHQAPRLRLRVRE